MIHKALDFVMPPDSFRTAFHLESAAGDVMYQERIGNKLIYQKTLSGYVQPADVNYFDANLIYQGDTDYGPWEQGTKAFKRFASKDWPGGGIAWCPLLIDDSVPAQPLVTNDSTFDIYANCSVASPSNVGQVIATATVWDGFGGDGNIPPNLPFLVVQYQWGNAANLETDVYVQGYGWVSWTLSTLVNGVYVQQKQSLFNKVVAGGTPYPLTFACP